MKIKMVGFLLFVTSILFNPIFVFAETECDESKADLHVILSQYGKPVKGSSGTLTYCDEFTKKFRGNIDIKGLQPNNYYLLCFNGKVGMPGNDKDHLPSKCNNEYYLDIMEIKTNSSGNYSGKVKSKLSSGDYDVKFLVKDKQDWKVVLHNDFIKFEMLDN